MSSSKNLNGCGCGSSTIVSPQDHDHLGGACCESCANGGPCTGCSGAAALNGETQSGRFRRKKPPTVNSRKSDPLALLGLARSRRSAATRTPPPPTQRSGGSIPTERVPQGVVPTERSRSGRQMNGCGCTARALGPEDVALNGAHPISIPKATPPTRALELLAFATGKTVGSRRLNGDKPPAPPIPCYHLAGDCLPIRANCTGQFVENTDPLAGINGEPVGWCYPAQAVKPKLSNLTARPAPVAPPKTPRAPGVAQRFAAMDRTRVTPSTAANGLAPTMAPAAIPSASGYAVQITPVQQYAEEQPMVVRSVLTNNGAKVTDFVPFEYTWMIARTSDNAVVLQRSGKGPDLNLSAGSLLPGAYSIELRVTRRGLVLAQDYSRFSVVNRTRTR